MLGSSFKILDLKARAILDSRGTPTVEVKLRTRHHWVVDAAPSGASTGEREAWELRDGEKAYWGKGVNRAVDNVNNIIAPALLKKDVRSQKKIDNFLIQLDGTSNKSHLGANAILPVSLAISRAAAKEQHLPLWRYLHSLSPQFDLRKEANLPQPSFNILNGGVHAGNKLSIQEFMILPLKNHFSENLEAGAEIYHALKETLMKEEGLHEINVGDEGGVAPSLPGTKAALDLIMKAIGRAGYPKTRLGIDCAASEFYQKGKYLLDGTWLDEKQLLSFYQNLIKAYPFLFIEDPFDQEDWSGFEEITRLLQDQVAIIGDDLLTTNPKQIQKAIEKKAVSGSIIKPNQIGTLSETLEAISLVQNNGWKVIISHRSGETNDAFIADLAVGVGADFLKSGAPVRGERVAKYNRLLAIEEEIKLLS